MRYPFARQHPPWECDFHTVPEPSRETVSCLERVRMTRKDDYYNYSSRPV